MAYHVYIMTNRPYGTLYVGVTNDLYERFDRILDAIRREKRLKHWNRAWKIKLIGAVNPNWEDLNPAFL